MNNCSFTVTNNSNSVNNHNTNRTLAGGATRGTAVFSQENSNGISPEPEHTTFSITAPAFPGPSCTSDLVLNNTSDPGGGKAVEVTFVARVSAFGSPQNAACVPSERVPTQMATATSPSKRVNPRRSRWT